MLEERDVGRKWQMLVVFLQPSNDCEKQKYTAAAIFGKK